jgi:transposase
MTFAPAVTLLDTMPGVTQRGGAVLVAEWGLDLARFGTAARLAAWSGVAPGNDESAGTQRSGKTRQGNQAVRTALTPLAHAAARTKGTYLSALYQRLATRRGKKRAISAVAHSIVGRAFHRRLRSEPDRAWGAHDFAERRQAHRVDQLTRRLERLGYRVTLEPVAAA